MTRINTCRCHMFKAKQTFWSSEAAFKLRCLKKFQEGEKQDCVAFVKVYQVWGVWSPGAPWRCGGTRSTPSFAHLHHLERVTNAGVCGQCPAKKYDFSFPISAKENHSGTLERCLVFRSMVQSPFGCQLLLCGSTAQSASSSLVCIMTYRPGVRMQHVWPRRAYKEAFTVVYTEIQ